MTSLIYDTGTVSVTNGSSTVTGTGTGWAVALIRYGLFSCDGLSIPIASVESDTSLTLAYDWPGTTGAEKPYALYLNSDHAGNAVWTNRLITDVIKNLALVGIHPDGSGTLAQRNALSPAPEPGYIWLHCEPGSDLTIYRKVSSGWEGPFLIRGPAGVGTGGIGLPSGGTIGQILLKAGSGDGDAVWEAPLTALGVEQGSWTPSYVPASGAFGSISYHAQTTGRYLKIGTAVVISGTIRLTALTVGTASGAVSIAGLPLPAATGFGISLGWCSGFTRNPDFLGAASGTSINLYKRDSIGASMAQSVVGDMNPSGANWMTFSGVYNTAS